MASLLEDAPEYTVVAAEEPGINTGGDCIELRVVDWPDPMYGTLDHVGRTVARRELSELTGHVRTATVMTNAVLPCQR